MTATAITENPPGPLSPPAGASTAGRGELGTINISESVVAKLAAQAALEIPDAGAAGPRLLGRSLPSASSLGARTTSLTALPKTSAHVDGSLALIRLQISVRWPVSVPAVTTAVREHVRTRVSELTGLIVAEVTIQVSDLVTELAQPPRRVR
ncbi:MAG: Asp23/Gls24 family envelope stress response protein [Jatrophihabitantaceae bacterium]